MGCNSSMDTNSVLDEPAAAGLNGLNLPPSRWPLSHTNHSEVIREFVRLDEAIGKLEGTCPGPRLATCEAWIEHLQSRRNELLGLDSRLLNDDGSLSNQATLPAISSLAQQPHLPSHIMDDNQEMYIDGFTAEQALPYNNNNAVAMRGSGGVNSNGQQPANSLFPLPMKYTSSNGAIGGNDSLAAKNDGVGGGGGMVNGGVPRLFPSNNLVAKTPSHDLVNLALNLGVIGDLNKASTHEDFFAQLSESALHLMTLRCYNEILEHTKVRLKTLMESFAELNELYVNHDGIIAFISGGTYMSRLEESLDSQLEVARDVRDKLGSTLEQWRICGLLLRACANSATQSLKQWRTLKTIINPKDKIEKALVCRKDLQASLVSLECAQLSLPHVEIKYTSNRQILAVKHCNTYMITDIANLARYEHTTKVFTAYESNVSKASAWIYETFNKTLRPDYDRAEERVKDLAKTLRDHREEIFTFARK
ncbi:BH3-only protein sayonara [Haematobia irritans]|uniref:BH3-only protein sayonara n=1 Tax=Haematobia irritans TaxID=7368 RepID=UPI003F4FD82B